MSGELQTDYTTGRTVYAQLRNSAGQIWNGAAFEAYATANIANYDIAMTEQGSASGFYVGDMPVVAQGIYSIDAKERIGGAPAESDPTVGGGNLEWAGTALTDLAAMADKFLGRAIAGGADGGRTVSQALAASRNKVAFDVPVAGQFTVYAADDATPLWTGTYTASAGANPVTVLDPV